MPYDKTGNYLTWKEFLVRWKNGIAGLTVLQQTKSMQTGNYIILLGLSLGIISCAFAIKNLWWVEIILFGGLINQIITIIGTRQKIKIYKEMEDSINNLEK